MNELFTCTGRGPTVATTGPRYLGFVNGATLPRRSRGVLAGSVTFPV